LDIGPPTGTGLGAAQYFATTGPPNLRSRPSVTTE
jgi:hypothetical protein